MTTGEWTVKTHTIMVPTNGEIDIIDITEQIQEFVRKTGIQEGNVTIFHPGSTAAITSIEYEEGLVQDLKKMISSIIPRGAGYRHDLIDDNAHSHLRATLLRPNLTIPITTGIPILGTWQQVVLVDLDVRPRNRRVVLQAMGVKPY